MIESTINLSVVSNDNLVPRVLSVPTISNLKIEIKQKNKKKTFRENADPRYQVFPVLVLALLILLNYYPISVYYRGQKETAIWNTA